MSNRYETYSLDKNENKGHFALTLLGNKAGDTVAFLGEIVGIGFRIEYY